MKNNILVECRRLGNNGSGTDVGRSPPRLPALKGSWPDQRRCCIYCNLHDPYPRGYWRLETEQFIFIGTRYTYSYLRPLTLLIYLLALSLKRFFSRRSCLMNNHNTYYVTPKLVFRIWSLIVDDVSHGTHSTPLLCLMVYYVYLLTYFILVVDALSVALGESVKHSSNIFIFLIKYLPTFIYICFPQSRAMSINTLVKQARA